jgi:ribosomal-protein-alanine N-acetyltransferase
MLEHYRRHGYGMYALVHKPDGAVIGRCGFKFWEELGRVEIGWLLARAYWGQGLAFEAAQSVLASGFEQQNFSEIIAIIDRLNLASSKLAEKLGMRFERELDFGYKTPDCYRIDRAEFFRRKVFSD